MTGAATRAWTTLGALSLSAGLVYALQSGLGNALPTIGHDLGMSLVALQWTVTGLSLAGSVLLVLGGRLADLVGRAARS